MFLISYVPEKSCLNMNYKYKLLDSLYNLKTYDTIIKIVCTVKLII